MSAKQMFLFFAIFWLFFDIFEFWKISNPKQKCKMCFDNVLDKWFENIIENTQVLYYESCRIY